MGQVCIPGNKLPRRWLMAGGGHTPPSVSPGGAAPRRVPYSFPEATAGGSLVTSSTPPVVATEEDKPSASCLPHPSWSHLSAPPGCFPGSAPKMAGPQVPGSASAFRETNPQAPCKVLTDIHSSGLNLEVPSSRNLSLISWLPSPSHKMQVWAKSL